MHPTETGIKKGGIKTMTNVTKMPQRQEGQKKDLYRLEERMHYILGQIGECERIIRQAQEAESRMRELRKELLELTGEYGTFIVQMEGA